MKITNFQKKVYGLCKKVPKGRVTTYKEIARKLGTKAYRAVGTALNRNPFAPVVPCHRVVNSNGSVGGFSRGTINKVKLLKKERIAVKNDKIADFKKYVYKFS